MKEAMILKMLSMAYREILRELLLKAIDDPDTEWDNWALRALDALFQYEA